MSHPDPQPPTPASHPRRRFSLLDLLLGMMLLAALLALGTQLGHVGFGLFCFLTAMVVGWRRGDRRQIAVGVCGLVIFSTTYAASWVRFGEMQYSVEFPFVWLTSNFADAERRLDEYYREHGRYPAALSQLPPDRDYSLYGVRYERRGDSYHLAYLGLDEEPGGIGHNADLTWHEGRFQGVGRLTLWQFLFETRYSSGLFAAAFAASLAGGYVCYGVQEIERAGWTARLAMWGSTILASAVVAVILAGFEVVLSKSGH